MITHFSTWAILILLITFFFTRYRRWQQKAAIKQWYKHLDLKKQYANFQQLYQGVDGFSLSRLARAEHDAFEYTYGEIDFVSFIALLSLTNVDANTIFYDLGSGVGKAVIACAMVFNVRKSCGFELFSNLHLTAMEQHKKLESLVGCQEKAKAIHFINGNYLHADFNDATLIFINATALFGDTWIEINQRIEQICPAATIITTSKKLTSHFFEVKRTSIVQMSWGPVRAYIHYPTT